MEKHRKTYINQIAFCLLLEKNEGIIIDLSE